VTLRNETRPHDNSSPQLDDSPLQRANCLVNLAFLKPGQIEEPMSIADEVSRMLAAMIRTLGKKSPKG
jgi:hypothetical protein